MDWFHILILAQAESGISDFARQIPVGLIAMFCGSGLALVGLTFLILRARASRSQQAQQAQPTHYTVPPPMSSTDLSDLPDLDALVSTPPPARKAAPPPSPQPMPAARASRKETYSVRPADGDATQAVEVVTILRDVVDGTLLIQMGDKTYRDPNNDATFKNSFVKIMRELGPVVRQETRSQPTQPATSTPQAADAGSLRDLLVTEDDTEDDTDDAEAPTISIAAAPPPTVGGQMPGDLPRFSLDEEPQVVKKRGGLLGRTKKEFAPVPELDLASAIEAYLQHKLRHSDQFHQRSIHIHPSPDGAVAIEVDGTFFESVGDVNEPDVRAFLAATIQEWQERNKR